MNLAMQDIKTLHFQGKSFIHSETGEVIRLHYVGEKWIKDTPANYWTLGEFNIQWEVYDGDD